MSELEIFKNEMFEVAITLENGEILFDVETVAKSLGFTQKKNGSVFVRWERVNDHLSKYSPQVGKGDYISEPMVYKLAFKANNKVAEDFQDWLAVEVLPAIRKHGMYARDELLDNPDFLLDVVSKYKAERDKRIELEENKMMLEQVIAEHEPKIDYLNIILSSNDTVTTTQIAADYGMSAQALNKLLHDLHVQHKVGGQWILYRRHMNQGYTKSHTSEIPQADGSMKTVMNTKWTQKGRLFIYELLKGEGYSPQMDLENIE